MVDMFEIFKQHLHEDAVVGAVDAAASDVVSSGNANDGLNAPIGSISNDEVLGSCDHRTHGYMAAGCFHIPKNVLKRYRPFQVKKRKNAKNPYMKGMLMIGEAELDKKTILAIHKLDSTDVLNFINRSYDFIGSRAAKTVEAIAYWPKDKLYLIKVKLDDGAKTFVLADFDGKQFIAKDDMKPISAEEALRMYAKDSKQAEMWVVYGFNELDETDDRKFYSLDDIMAALSEVPERYMSSQVHVGPYGRHIGDIESIEHDGSQVCLNLKKAHTSMRRGLVEGCMKAKDVIAQLSSLQHRYAGKTVQVYAVQQLDPLSKQLGKKADCMMVIDVEIANVDGIWFRV